MMLDNFTVTWLGIVICSIVHELASGSAQAETTDGFRIRLGYGPIEYHNLAINIASLSHNVKAGCGNVILHIRIRGFYTHTTAAVGLLEQNGRRIAAGDTA
ncbi:hypothetical protein F4777DRAFT_533566 [Nemania sp. FL0916]|nr:hypothetical protein F4777DRAFT_533566 [Nemania sp. FL0916]